VSALSPGSRGRLLALTATLILVALSGPAAAAPPDPPARSWLLVDAHTGRQLAGKGASRTTPIASATKLMTAYLALRRLPLARRLPAPAYDSLPAESKIDLRAGERMSVHDLLRALLLESANDAAVTLARGVAGTVPRFVSEMNRAARQLGLRGTRFANPIGLDQEGNHSSAGDLAKLTLRLRRRAVFRRIVDSAEVILRTGDRRRRVLNRNRLVRTVSWVDGVKTGHTRDAGYVLIGSAARDGLGLVSVVLGAPSEAARDSATLGVLNYGFNRYRRVTPARRGVALASVKVRFSGQRLRLAPLRTAALAVPRGRAVETRVETPDRVEGPIDRGERVGRAIVTLGGTTLTTVPLGATVGVPAPGFADRVREGVESPLALLVLGFLTAVAGILLARRRSTARR
jgi:serine-type D-Ala-D-Ala carboxypeptidase (penicillin-binding protein 5/6)